MKYALSGIVLCLYLLPLACLSQESAEPPVTDKVINFPSKLFSRIQGKTADLDKQLTSQTDKYLAKMARREERIKKKLYQIDSSAAKNLFAGDTPLRYRHEVLEPFIQQYRVIRQHDGRGISTPNYYRRLMTRFTRTVRGTGSPVSARSRKPTRRRCHDRRRDVAKPHGNAASLQRGSAYRRPLLES